MKDEPLIGRLITGAAQRDAIHVAIAPVVAAEVLKPGQHVGLDIRGRAEVNCKAIGIVDPFLLELVGEGEQFYLFLYPRTVTSLRHEWTHPAFPSAPPTPADVKAGENGGSVAESEAWLRKYAAEMNPYDGAQAAYKRLLAGLRAGRILAYGRDLHGLDDVRDAAELAYHAGVVLGGPINLDEFEFSCSC